MYCHGPAVSFWVAVAVTIDLFNAGDYRKHQEACTILGEKAEWRPGKASRASLVG